eukprot:3820612-Pleurochrysis_carterae.AAC.1
MHARRGRREDACMWAMNAHARIVSAKRGSSQLVHGKFQPQYVLSSTALQYNWSCVVVDAMKISARQSLYLLKTWNERFLRANVSEP